MAFLALLLALPARGADADLGVLWQIGKPDTNNAEFALAPRSYDQFKADGFFVVGQSDPSRDWPYVHPGPGDAWAGGREHTFTILFGLKTVPGEGDCRFTADLLDTQSQNPPRVRVTVNGQSFERALPRGAGDDSVRGQPARGRPGKLTVQFPSSLLKTGDNAVHITTIRGNWLLYDCVELETPAGAELTKLQVATVSDRIQPVRALLKGRNGTLAQPVLVTLRHFGGDTDGVVRVEGVEPFPIHIQSGMQTIEVPVPAVAAETQRKVSVEVGGQSLAAETVTLKPVRQLTVYMLPHSHTDIGYTEIQTAVEQKQMNNLLQGIEFARNTANYPAGARFVWNVEVLWAVDLYLHRFNDRQRADFLDAVKKGQVSLNGMYLNELTGLCRPEELLQLFRYATQVAEQTGVPIDSAMISDVPGYTWGTVPALTQAGIRYFSVAPNYFDRIGTILREWENKPFYWVGPDGKSKVLVWIPFWGYAMSHRYGQMSPQLVDDFCDGLQKRGYPYDIAYVRWAGHGDNATPDPAICEFVKEWNAKYAWPRFIISGTSEAFRALEQRYGDRLPVVHGDWTPYWEDGAGSSAFETAMNRTSSDRLTQAETLFAMRNPAAFQATAFQDAWRNVLLYSEHTWGADVSISAPESQKTKEQWEIKRGDALQADKQSRELLQTALTAGRADTGASSSSLDVYNSLSWTRTDLVVVSRELSAAGDGVRDDRGKPVPSQRLGSGELVFLARDVPPLGARRYTLSAAASVPPDQRARAQGAVLENGMIQVRVDEKTGGIVELTAKGIDGNFVDTSGGESLNDYLYLPGDSLADLKHNGPVTIRVGENGPLVASLIIESEAPGCKSLRREIRLVAGMDYVELVNTVDKARLEARSYRSNQGKESVNFGFPFNVPEGDILLDIPLGAMRPELDQMPSACKNWFAVGRWADVSNKKQGITWVTLDAPLVEIGGITANLLNSQTNPDVWRKKVERTQKIYSWTMNNHWGTNYRAYQEGQVVFRFILRPHRRPDPAEAARFGMARSYALLPVRASGTADPLKSLLHVEPADVLVETLKPADDGHGIIIRLFGASGEKKSATLNWAGHKPKAVFLSNTSEKEGEKINGSVMVPGYGLVTLRASMD